MIIKDENLLEGIFILLLNGYFKKIYFPCNISTKNIHLLSETSLLPIGG